MEAEANLKNQVEELEGVIADLKSLVEHGFQSLTASLSQIQAAQTNLKHLLYILTHPESDQATKDRITDVIHNISEEINHLISEVKSGIVGARTYLENKF